MIPVTAAQRKAAKENVIKHLQSGYSGPGNEPDQADVGVAVVEGIAAAHDQGMFEHKLETKEALQEVLASEEVKNTISGIIHEGVAAELKAHGFEQGKN
jgi:hypothetical protein